MSRITKIIKNFHNKNSRNSKKIPANEKNPVRIEYPCGLKDQKKHPKGCNCVVCRLAFLDL